MSPLRPRPALARLRSVSLLLPALAAVLSGCATSGLTDQWRDTQYRGGALTKVLVIAVTPAASRRRMLEDAFVSALGRHGATATPSYRLFEAATPDTQEVIEAVRANGFDGVLVASKMTTLVDRREVRGYTSAEERGRFNPWTQRYHAYLVEVRHPGYTETERVVRHRVDVWTTRDGGTLLWTAVGSSVDPASGTQIDREITAHVIPQLIHAGVLTK